MPDLGYETNGLPLTTENLQIHTESCPQEKPADMFGLHHDVVVKMSHEEVNKRLKKMSWEKDLRNITLSFEKFSLDNQVLNYIPGGAVRDPEPSTDYRLRNTHNMKKLFDPKVTLTKELLNVFPATLHKQALGSRVYNRIAKRNHSLADILTASLLNKPNYVDVCLDLLYDDEAFRLFWETGHVFSGLPAKPAQL